MKKKKDKDITIPSSMLKYIIEFLERSSDFYNPLNSELTSKIQPIISAEINREIEKTHISYVNNVANTDDQIKIEILRLKDKLRKIIKLRNLTPTVLANQIKSEKFTEIFNKKQKISILKSKYQFIELESALCVEKEKDYSAILETLIKNGSDVFCEYFNSDDKLHIADICDSAKFLDILINFEYDISEKYYTLIEKYLQINESISGKKLLHKFISSLYKDALRELLIYIIKIGKIILVNDQFNIKMRRKIKKIIHEKNKDKNIYLRYFVKIRDLEQIKILSAGSIAKVDINNDNKISQDIIKNKKIKECLLADIKPNVITYMPCGKKWNSVTLNCMV